MSLIASEAVDRINLEACAPCAEEDCEIARIHTAAVEVSAAACLAPLAEQSCKVSRIGLAVAVDVGRAWIAAATAS